MRCAYAPSGDGIAMLEQLEEILPDDIVPVFMSGYSDKKNI